MCAAGALLIKVTCANRDPHDSLPRPAAGGRRLPAYLTVCPGNARVQDARVQL